MGVLNGQPVDQAITNAAFINKNQDDVMFNKLGFSRALSGSTIADIQKAVNNLYTATGVSEIATGTVYNATPNTISNGDPYQLALAELANKFDAVTGHMHSGSAGEGPILEVVSSIAASGYSPAFGDFTFTPGSGIQISQVGTNVIFSATGSSTSIAVSGFVPLSGNITFVPSSGMSLTQIGQQIFFAATGGGGGGGGGSLQWVENADSPTPLFEHQIEVYGFDAGLSQSLYTTLKVPNSYGTGSPILMRTEFYSSDSTGTVLFQTVSTLIRTGTDAISSLTNQHTSTNGAITLSGGTVNIPQAIVLDLTDGSGHINGIAVTQNDTLIVQLKRGTDSATGTARNMSFATEVSFT